MKYRIYPQKEVVLAIFQRRLEAVEKRLAEPESIIYNPNNVTLRQYDEAERKSLLEELELLNSHRPSEVAVELED